MDLLYSSTRNGEEKVTASKAILKGLADDGGLFVPESIPKLDVTIEELAKMSYQETAYAVMKLFFTDFTEEELKNCINKAYDLSLIHILENTAGVTSRISGLFSRRRYNIDSFSSGVTADPRFTRITIVTSGDELVLEQIEKQLAKLEDVLDIKKLEPDNSVTRELIMVKIRACLLYTSRCV